MPSYAEVFVTLPEEFAPLLDGVWTRAPSPKIEQTSLTALDYTQV